ncbi:hypothetical protein BASA82_000244 [Batrachochytrium salamandrivorans]|nr:hypothetical protein BASA81_002142 [Batrachochytrium salamandrivorans]KAH9262723.1 hypothetical protein BASA82_000244 [Batrachochytrium salamandrivorans]
MSKLPPLAKPLGQIWCIATKRHESLWPKKFGGGGGDPLNSAVDAVSLIPNSLALVYRDESLGVESDFQLVLYSQLGFGKRFPLNLGVAEASASREFERVDGSMYFVCAHGTRDKRCGDRGMPIVQSLLDQGKRAFPCSHIGGHAFAGNVLVLPNAMWFSKVEPENSKEISLHQPISTCMDSHPFCRGCSW